jgi:acyl-CoA thioester hydrolase
MSSPDRLEPTFYRHWIEDGVRFADLDPLGHCNNAAIGGFFESSRVALFTDAGFPVSKGTLSIPIARIEIDFRHEILYGATVRVGARVLRIGRTSFTLAGAIFDADQCAAAAQVRRRPVRSRPAAIRRDPSRPAPNLVGLCLASTEPW